MPGSIEILSRPISLFQFRAGGSTLDVLFSRPRDVGTFTINQSPSAGLGPIRFRETNALTNGGSTVFEAPQNVVTEFTVQVFPCLCPFALVCCSNNTYPKIESDPIFLCCKPYDLNIIAGAADPTKPAIDAGRKVMFGDSAPYGPFKIGGDYRYFRVLAYEPNQAFGISGNLIEYVAGASVPTNLMVVDTLAVVSVYGF